MATWMLEYDARVRRALEDRAKKDGSPVPRNVEIVQIVLNVASEPWGPVEGILVKGLRFTYEVVDAIDTATPRCGFETHRFCRSSSNRIPGRPQLRH